MPLCHEKTFSGFDYNLCNQEHRFSRWLIQNQKELKEHAPGLYDEMLRAMGFNEDGNSFIMKINAMLTQLRGYRNNYFGVTDELFLTDADLWNAEWEEK